MIFKNNIIKLINKNEIDICINANKNEQKSHKSQLVHSDKRFYSTFNSYPPWLLTIHLKWLNIFIYFFTY